MTRVHPRGEDVRRFLVENLRQHPNDISKVAATHFGITRQAVSKHLQRLRAEGCITESGETRSRAYKLAPLSEWRRTYEIVPGLAEDVIWTNDVRAQLGALPDNALGIWHYGFTEIFNNAIDHSAGTSITVTIKKTAACTELALYDNGIGIFKKIQMAIGLLDERHAVLELAKGKLTTDPKRHTGEGIFFTSRMFDDFQILAGGVFFSHEYGDQEDWALENERTRQGTMVWMRLNNHTARTSKKVFDQYTSGDEFGFTKTVVPVRLALYGNDKLISRSQAKRVVARIEVFKTVILNFESVDSIGPAFADEIFRVFATQHPNIEMIVVRANSEVKRMIERAKSEAAKEA